MSPEEISVEFEVEEETEGGFSASAQVGNYSMVTQGETLDELRTMIADLVQDYNAHESGRIVSYSLAFSCTTPVAA